MAYHVRIVVNVTNENETINFWGQVGSSYPYRISNFIMTAERLSDHNWSVWCIKFRKWKILKLGRQSSAKRSSSLEPISPSFGSWWTAAGWLAKGTGSPTSKHSWLRTCYTSSCRSRIKFRTLASKWRCGRASANSTSTIRWGSGCTITGLRARRSLALILRSVSTSSTISSMGGLLQCLMLIWSSPVERNPRG